MGDESSCPDYRDDHSLACIGLETAEVVVHQVCCNLHVVCTALTPHAPERIAHLCLVRVSIWTRSGCHEDQLRDGWREKRYGDVLALHGVDVLSGALTTERHD